MATSALDLLIALDARLDDLETTTMLPGSIPRVRQEWGALARASLQLLQARPRHPNDTARRLEALLDSLAAAPGEYPLPAPGSGLMAIAATIGCTAEVMRVRIVASPAAREQAGEAIRTSLEAALARAARWTQRGSLYAHAEPEPEIARLAGSDADPHRSPALQNWRIIGSTDSGIDGAVARWESAATAAVSSLRTVTQLALQLTSADIALLCASTSAILRGAIQAGAVPDAPAVAAALDDAGRSWREAARWPRKFRLGGRALDLRHASADLRQCLDESLRTGSGWKHSSALFAQTSPEHLVAVAHSGLQSATRVGQHVLAALQELTYGSSRIWRDARQTPMPAASSHSGLDGLRYEWRPDSVGSNSAKELHDQTSRAMTRLTHATLLTTEVCLSHTRRPEQISDDEGPWETVSPPLEPLRSAQERATRAAIAPSDPPAHTLGL